MDVVVRVLVHRLVDEVADTYRCSAHQDNSDARCKMLHSSPEHGGHARLAQKKEVSQRARHGISRQPMATMKKPSNKIAARIRM